MTYTFILLGSGGHVDEYGDKPARHFPQWVPTTLNPYASHVINGPGGLPADLSQAGNSLGHRPVLSYKSPNGLSICEEPVSESTMANALPRLNALDELIFGTSCHMAVKEVVNLTLNHRFEEIAILGYSRGAMEAIWAAYILFQQRPNVKVSLFLIDPVGGHQYNDLLHLTTLNQNVKHAVICRAKDEQRKSFMPLPIQVVNPAITVTQEIIVPGHHSMLVKRVIKPNDITHEPLARLMLQLWIKFCNENGIVYKNEIISRSLGNRAETLFSWKRRPRYIVPVTEKDLYINYLQLQTVTAQITKKSTKSFYYYIPFGGRYVRYPQVGNDKRFVNAHHEWLHQNNPSLH